jgi:hypothetical protein
VRGFLFKYQAALTDDFLRDKGPHISDPDFWSNSMPVWAVCGVYFRKGLEPDDVLFFIPQKRSYPQGMSPYHFTGFLTCSMKTDGRSLRSLGGISVDFAGRYQISLDEHLALDKPKTKKIRASNVVIGTKDSESSRWFGDHSIPVQPLLREAGLKSQLAALEGRNNNIPPLDGTQTVKLRRKLISLTGISKGMGPFPPAYGTSKCRTCAR